VLPPIVVLARAGSGYRALRIVRAMVAGLAALGVADRPLGGDQPGRRLGRRRQRLGWVAVVALRVAAMAVLTRLRRYSVAGACRD
jgi:hypothetical protein